MSGEIPYCTERRKPTGMSFLGLKTIAEKICERFLGLRLIHMRTLSKEREKRLIFHSTEKMFQKKFLSEEDACTGSALDIFDGRHNLLKEVNPVCQLRSVQVGCRYKSIGTGIGMHQVLGSEPRETKKRSSTVIQASCGGSWTPG